MSVQQEPSEEPLAAFEYGWKWRVGALAGFVATVMMGLVITVVDLETLRVAIAGLYGQSGTLVVGWLAHLVHGTVFGVLFAAVLTDPSLHRVHESTGESVAAGLVYGLVLAVVGAGIIMPMWLEVVALPSAPPLPNITLPILAWHLVYGAVLGAAFARFSAE